MGLSEADKALCLEAFKLYEEAPGKISAANLGTVMRAPGANPSEEDLEKITGGKASVSQDQYLSAMAKFTLHQDTSNEVAECFAIFDAEGKGSVDCTELRSVLGNLGERFSQEEIGQLMLMAEVDADNRMSIQDIVDFCKEYR